MAASSYRAWRPSALEIAAVLGGKPHGRSYVCPCPVPGHLDKHPSFYIAERGGKVVFICRSGCGQDAVLAALKGRGLWPDCPDDRDLPRDRAGAASSNSSAEARRDGKRDPFRWWRASSSKIRDSLIPIYLGARRIEDLTDAELKPLRFHPSLFHWPSKTEWPCMLALVARVQPSGLREPITCHMTFLARDGQGKAPLQKERLFPSGASPAGGGVWFGAIDPGAEVIVGEGIESTLSAMRLYGAQAGVAALSALGVEKLVLPPEARQVRIFADRDELQQGFAAAAIATRRWRAEGREVAMSQAATPGWDANDVLVSRLTSKPDEAAP